MKRQDLFTIKNFINIIVVHITNDKWLSDKGKIVTMSIKESNATSCLLLLVICVVACSASTLQSFHRFDFQLDHHIKRQPQAKRVLSFGK